MGRFLLCALLVAALVAGPGAVGASPGSPEVRLPVHVPEDRQTVVVEPGDHLWKISANRLSRVTGHDASDAEVWPYWRAVIEANRDRLRSGDPDLIYPGEVIEMPEHPSLP